MKIKISGKQIELTDAIKNAVEQKLERLENYLQPETDIRVTVSARKARQKVEVTILPISGPIIRAEDTEEDLYAAIDIVCDKLSTQLRKYKTRIQDKHKINESIRFSHVKDLSEDDLVEEDDEDSIKIERYKKFNMKPMSPEEAVLQMDLLGHDFFMFRNTQTEEISIVYKRKNGGYGMIEQE